MSLPVARLCPFRAATLALAGVLALAAAGCQREEQVAERPSPPAAQPTETAQTAPPATAPSAVPSAAPTVPSAQLPPPPAVEPDRRAAELGQNPQTVTLPPEPPPFPPAPRSESLAAREKRLAARQAELDRREQRLRQREQEASPAAAAPEPAPEPSPAAPEAPAEAPQPAPAPLPRPRVNVPAGTGIDVELSTALSSATSKVGDLFRCRVVRDIAGEDGAIAIPAGSEIAGEVTQAVATKTIGGQASLGLRFTDLVLPSGETVPIQASLVREGRNESKRAAATIGGSAAGGAILGNILSRGSRGQGSILGALIGAAAGAAIAAHNHGQEIEVPQGTVLGLQLDEAVRVHSQAPTAPPPQP